MAEFIDKLPSSKITKLLNRMKINSSENVLDAEVSGYDNKLHVVHGKDKHNNYVESIYSDYLIIKIYNSTPSEYDQLIFQQTMRELCGPTYSVKCDKFNKNRNKIFNGSFKEGDFCDEEEYTED